MSRDKQEAIGLRVVAQVVREMWESRWQEFDKLNDDGIDGIVQLRRRKRQTGALVFVQVKCGPGYRQDARKRPGQIGLNLGEEYIEKHRPRWRNLPGPAVLVFVDPSLDERNPHAWWTDLNSEQTYTPDNRAIVLLPRSQRFGLHSKGDFFRLCGAAPTDRLLPLVRLSRTEVSSFRLSQPLKAEAWRLYREWATASDEERTNPALGVVTISRAGWRHMCRCGRRPERIIQSWLLLSAARAIIKEVTQWGRLGHTITRDSGTDRTILDFVGARAKVHFPHRRPGVVQVVLKRIRTFDTHAGIVKSRTLFYSVYEQNEKNEKGAF